MGMIDLTFKIITHMLYLQGVISSYLLLLLRYCRVFFSVFVLILGCSIEICAMFWFAFV